MARQGLTLKFRNYAVMQSAVCFLTQILMHSLIVFCQTVYALVMLNFLVCPFSQASCGNIG